MNVSSKIDRKFQQEKKAALELLEWNLRDISPDADHPLVMRVGIEREGHFIHPFLEKFTEFKNIDDWFERSAMKIKNITATIEFELREKRKELGLERLYHDESGTFLVEFNTYPLSPARAAQAAVDISREILNHAHDLYPQMQHMGFGTINANFLKDMEAQFGADFHDGFGGLPPYYFGQVFEASPYHGHPQDLLLVGRGQHCNISLWCGNKNLFSVHDRPPPQRPEHQSQWPYMHSQLGMAIAHEAYETLPGMILPSRAGNYYRTQQKCPLSIVDHGLSNNCKALTTLNWISNKDKHELAHVDNYTRLEFRQGASEADPYDLVLAAAVPSVKACFDYAFFDDAGKARLTAEGGLCLTCNQLGDCPEKPMADSHEAAAVDFNRPDNPSFMFLNRMAQRKYTRLEEEITKNSDNKQLQQELRDAKKLLGIGTRLHQYYCEQYGMQSVMPQPAQEMVVG